MNSSSAIRRTASFAIAFLCFAVTSETWANEKHQPGDREIRIPTLDISGENERHVVIAEGTDETYQGHPTTLLMPDGKTMFCVWTVNHGGPCGPLKRSDDGGKTWADLLPVPDNWREVNNCPALYRLAGPAGPARLFVFAGQGPNGSMCQSHSEDGGKTWSPMAPNGLVCVMPFCTIMPIDGGTRLLAMSNIRRPGETTESHSNVVSQSMSSDGGLTWSEWRIVFDLPGCKPCEPELVRSPDGKQLLCLMRENNRSFNAWKMVSDDEGQAWTEPAQLPASLSGDRHKACYAPDGRLVICFRDTATKSPTKNHFVAWVGAYDDIIAGREGHYRVKLLHSYAGGDCGYPGLEGLPDGTFVATTYIKYKPGPRKNSVVSVRFKFDELDQKVLAGQFVTRAPSFNKSDKPVPIGKEPQLFVDDDMVAKQSGLTRAIHACRKLPKPVLESEFPWEGDDGDSRVYLYGTVLRDAESGEFRMWYNRLSRELFATSKDGIHWERPRLGLVDLGGSRENNIVMIKFHSPSFILDSRETDPAKRYKMLGSMGSKGYGVAFSADGLRWHPYPVNPVLRGSDTCTLAQDPRTQEFLAFHKIHASHRGHSRRLVWLAASRDMQTWSEPRLVMAPDEIDDAQTRADGGLWSEFYNMSAFPRGGQFLGLVTHFRYRGKPPEEGPGQSPADGPIDVQLVHSRDGREWRRLAERVPVIPNGPHDYDAGCILGVANQPVIVGDEMWIYYTAINTTHGGSLPKKKITIARAAWRLDGFVSLDAGDEQGVVETIPLQPAGDRLAVNADASKGELRVEVLDASGKPIAGYEAESCVPITEDSVRRPVRWKEKDQLPAGKPIRLRFLMRNAQLFSYAAGPAAT